MANPLLPAQLQRALPLRCPLEPVDSRVQFQPEAGPAIVWAMERIPPKTIPVSGRVLWSHEVDLLEGFGINDLVGWVLPFDWVDPWPGAGTRVFQFRTMPTYLPVAPAREWDNRPNQIQYETSFVLTWRPWFPAVQVG